MFCWLLWREFFILYLYPLNIQEVFLLLFLFLLQLQVSCSKLKYFS